MSDALHQAEESLAGKNLLQEEGEVLISDLSPALNPESVRHVLARYESLLEKIYPILKNGDSLQEEAGDIADAGYVLKPVVQGMLKAAEEEGVADPFLELSGLSSLGSGGGELLRSILTHLVSNSVAHGFEEKAVRIRKGKDPRGLIQIVCEKSGDFLAVTYKDDGKGMNQFCNTYAYFSKSV